MIPGPPPVATITGSPSASDSRVTSFAEAARLLVPARVLHHLTRARGRRLVAARQRVAQHRLNHVRRPSAAPNTTTVDSTLLLLHQLGLERLGCSRTGRNSSRSELRSVKAMRKELPGPS